jgi:imidazolonepropionase-like amidohydrolase
MQILLTNALVVDAIAASPRIANVLVEGVIREVDARPIGGADRQVIDLRGRTPIPGLIDCHVHVVASMLDLAANAQLPDTLAILRSLPILRGMLERGFTTVRDVGGAPHALAQALKHGLAAGPRLIVCGKALSKTGGHVDLRPRHDTHDPYRWRRSFGALGRVADSPDGVRLAAREELREGANFVKIMANGGISSPTDPVGWQGYSVAEIEAVVQEAADAGTYVSAHLYTADAIRRAVRAGVRSFEHCNLINGAVAEEVAAAGAIAVPTLVTFEALAEDGAKLGLPSDNLAKIETVRSAGLRSLRSSPPLTFRWPMGPICLASCMRGRARNLRCARRSCAAATSVAAQLLRMEGKIGTIAPGAYADLLVDGNPMEDVTTLASSERNFRLIMQNGTIYRSDIE